MGAKIGSLLGSVLSALIKIAVAIWVVTFVYTKTVGAYEFGFRVFTEPAVAQAPGTEITVSITEGKSYMDIAKILEEKGLVRDSKLAFVQILVSDFRENMQPGVFVLNTSMTTDEMVEVMAANSDADENGE